MESRSLPSSRVLWQGPGALCRSGFAVAVRQTGVVGVVDWALRDRRTGRIVVGLTRLDRALTGIDDEGYGACQRCGQPIGRPRLQAQPGTTRCMRCAVSP
jgi:hypothetical protein